MRYRLVRFTETESRMVVPGAGWRRGKGSFCLMGTEFQFYKTKRVLGVGCTTM